MWVKIFDQETAFYVIHDSEKSLWSNQSNKLNCWLSMDNLYKASVMYYTWESHKAQVTWQLETKNHQKEI